MFEENLGLALFVAGDVGGGPVDEFLEFVASGVAQEGSIYMRKGGGNEGLGSAPAGGAGSNAGRR